MAGVSIAVQGQARLQAAFARLLNHSDDISPALRVIGEYRDVTPNSALLTSKPPAANLGSRLAR